MTGTDAKLYEFWEIIQPEIMFYIKRNISANDVEDIMQDIFIVALEKFDRFIKPKGKHQKDIIDFKRWVYKIAANKIFNQKKRNSKRRHIDIDLLDKYISEQEDEIENSVGQMEFHQLISCLSEKDKNLIMLRVIDDLAFHDIAEKMKENISALKMRYYRAIKRLRKNI